MIHKGTITSSYIDGSVCLFVWPHVPCKPNTHSRTLPNNFEVLCLVEPEGPGSFESTLSDSHHVSVDASNTRLHVNSKVWVESRIQRTPPKLLKAGANLGPTAVVRCSFWIFFLPLGSSTLPLGWRYYRSGLPWSSHTWNLSLIVR